MTILNRIEKAVMKKCNKTKKNSFIILNTEDKEVIGVHICLYEPNDKNERYFLVWTSYIGSTILPHMKEITKQEFFDI